MRTFVAVSLDDEIRLPLAKMLRELAPQFGDAVKWVGPQNIHLTVKFLGQVDDAAVPEISKVIRGALRDIPSFSFSVKGVGFFPPKSAPRVLWVGVEKDHAHLETVYDRLNSELARFGVKRERRRFSPHITVGRVRSKSEVSRDVALKLLEPYSMRDYGLQEVTSVELMMSELRSDGPIYTKVASFPLPD